MADMHYEASQLAHYMGEDEDSAYLQSCPDCRKAGVDCNCIWNGTNWVPQQGEK